MSGHMVKHFYRSIFSSYKEIIKTACSLPKTTSTNSKCVISCKRGSLNHHYTNIIHNNLDEVPLASKGWNHSKSKGDFFTVHPIEEEKIDETPFRLLEINPQLVTVLNERNIINATKFQVETIPLIGTGKHLMLAAETGCGKTITYLVPIIQKLINNKSEELNTPKALIIVPNRELAYQIGEISQKLAEAVDLQVKIVVGGHTKQLMMNPEFETVDVLIGTPGALSKLTTVGIYKLDKVLYTVFDEADTLIDDSFIERMTSIFKRVFQSQIIFVSATLPKTLPDIFKSIEPSMKQVISSKLHKPLLNITQKFIRMTRSAKPSNLLQIAKGNKHPMLVFTNRTKTSNWLAMFLRENGIPCSNINGDMNYAIRIQQWNDFIKGNTKILSSTDIGSRGLNTTQVRHVVNYDFPIYAADYLHRVGRIGRLGSVMNCKATNFISGPEEVRLVQQIELSIRRNEALSHVDGNITNIVQKKISKGLRQAV